MNILYIDSATSIDKIRIETRSIFYKEFPKKGHFVNCLLWGEQGKVDRYNVNIYGYRKNIFSRLFVNIPLLITLIKVFQSNEVNLVVVRNEIKISLISLIYSKIKKIPFIFLKPYPEIEKMEYEYKNTSNKFYKLLNYIKYKVYQPIEQYILDHSNLICPISTSYINYLEKSKGISKSKMCPIPMGFDKDSYDPIRKNEKHRLKNKYCTDSEILILYFGTLHRRRNLDFLIDAFTIAYKKESQINLLLIGGNSTDYEELVKPYRDSIINNNIFHLEEMDRNNLNKYIQAADLTVSPIPPLFIYKISSPTKVVESLGIGTPVLANEEIIDQKNIIEESGGGMCSPYNTKSFAQAIVNLAEDPIKLSEMGEKGRDYILKKRTYRNIANEFNKHIQNLFGKA